jgi:hypothetical protein
MDCLEMFSVGIGFRQILVLKRSSDRPEGFDEAISPKITHFPAVDGPGPTTQIPETSMASRPKKGVALTFGHAYGFVPM